MEIEPGVIECAVLQFVEKFREFVADLLLTTLLVNQVNKVLLIVLRVGLLDM